MVHITKILKKVGNSRKKHRIPSKCGTGYPGNQRSLRCGCRKNQGSHRVGWKGKIFTSLYLAVDDGSIAEAQGRQKLRAGSGSSPHWQAVWAWAIILPSFGLWLYYLKSPLCLLIMKGGWDLLRWFAQLVQPPIHPFNNIFLSSYKVLVKGAGGTFNWGARPDTTTLIWLAQMVEAGTKSSHNKM